MMVTRIKTAITMMMVHGTMEPRIKAIGMMMVLGMMETKTKAHMKMAQTKMVDRR